MPTYVVRERKEDNYGCLMFLFDCFMFCITAGLWLIWVFVREMRRKKKYKETVYTDYYLD